MSQVGALPVDSSILPSFISVETNNIKERIYSSIRPELERIEAEIERQLTTDVPLIGVIGRYIMGSGGKRLRPLLMILCAKLCGYQGNHDAKVSVVFEFLHAASLLHDDVVDHAEFRRNKPAANTIWGNPGVVLAGDFLYSKAILMTVQYKNIHILEVLSETTTKMAEGEVLQLIHSDNLETNEQEYLEIITRKTAVLISAACRIGAIFGGGDTEQELALRDYGYHLGIAFQLIDDTLDYTGDEKELGKPVGNDIKEGKTTLPLIAALRTGQAKEVNRLREIFSTEEIPAELFIEVRDLVIRSGGIDYTKRLAVEHVQSAKKAIGIFPSSTVRDTLADIADYVIYRRV